MKDKTYEELVDENTALAAHVERLTGALELARDRIEILANIATDHGAYVYAALDIWPEGVAKILAESPTTSLARLKAEWQAEALEERARAFRDAPLKGECRRWHHVAAGTLERKAAKLRRQAEESQP